MRDSRTLKTDETIYDDINLLVDSVFFWNSLNPGDKIILDADLFLDGEHQLHKDEAYEILAKMDRGASDMAFVVQSDITDDLVDVHPFLVSDYLISPESNQLN